MNISKTFSVNFNGKVPNNIRQMVISGPKAGQKLICKYQGDPLNNFTALGYDFVETNNGVRKTIDSVLIKNNNGLNAEAVASLCERMEEYLDDAYDMFFELYKHSKRSL